MSGSQIMVVSIVLIVSIFSLLKTRYRARHGIITDNAGNEAALTHANAALQHEVGELRERIQVLERIATDGRQAHFIAAEIEALRDERTTA